MKGSQTRIFIRQHKWWILAATSSIAFLLICLLAFIVISGNKFQPEDEIIAEYTATPAIITTNHPTMTAPVAELVPATTATMVDATEITEYRQLAFVNRVIDGDSIEVIIDNQLFQVRYIGIDAPETGMPHYKEATEANKNLVEGKIVEMESDISNTDRYDRLLRYVYLPGEIFVNAKLVSLGLASANPYPPDTKYQDLLDAEQQTAKTAGLGMWSQVLVPIPDENLNQEIQILVDPGCSQFNAPGNDNDNKNGEYVCIVNESNRMVELGGWSIHDEYGWTYQIPPINFEANSIIQIYTGCGENSNEALYWCKDETAVWNNDGDCVYIIDADGSEKNKYCY